MQFLVFVFFAFRLIHSRGRGMRAVGISGLFGHIVKSDVAECIAGANEPDLAQGTMQLSW